MIAAFELAERYNRNIHVEITGVPEVPVEKIESVVAQLSQIVQIPIDYEMGCRLLIEYLLTVNLE